MKSDNASPFKRLPIRSPIEASIIVTGLILAAVLLIFRVGQASAAPDLIETYVSNPPATAAVGGQFWVADTVKNQGDQSSGTCVTQYYLSLTGIKGTGSSLLSGRRSVSGLKPGKGSKGVALVKITAGTPAGIYYVLACANNTGVVQEGNDTNNCLSSAKTVHVTAPDLLETAVTDPPLSASAGDRFSVNDTVKNQGDRKAAASVTRYYFSSTAIKDVDAKLLTGQRSVPALVQGATSAGKTTVQIPPGTSNGDYYLLACADGNNRLVESNETNNCVASATRVTIGSAPSPGGEANVLPITVNGSLCSSNSYPNKPCVSVTICGPGTTDCQTIDDILLDTGSFGLRVFSQALTVPLTQVGIGSAALTECVQYGDGSSNWGPVKMARVVLGDEPAVQVPIQVIDATFGNPPGNCHNADISPADAGFNGILGLGPFVQDCGSTCAPPYNLNGMYYACSGSGCIGTAVPLAEQVTNPVALLPEDNNGIIVQLPNVPPGGSVSVNGLLLLGIGTRANNTPSPAVVAYAVDQNTGDFSTAFGGNNLSGFLDTGSNGLFFPSFLSSLPSCRPPNSDWFCPSTTANLSATNIGAFGLPAEPVSFKIGNFIDLISSPNNVFSDVGGDNPNEFDWGLPFHLGRNVCVGIEGRPSGLGTGPYWAY